MFRKIGDWFRNFMAGRYGSDKLNVALLLTGVALTILGALLGRFKWAGILTILSYAVLFWCIFRMYARDHRRRSRENTAFLNFFRHLQDREHRYFRCPNCRQAVRVPRGRGKINIRCPKCSEQFIKHT